VTLRHFASQPRHTVRDVLAIPRNGAVSRHDRDVEIAASALPVRTQGNSNASTVVTRGLQALDLKMKAVARFRAWGILRTLVPNFGLP
jgi:hypothetical protein